MNYLLFGKIVRRFKIKNKIDDNEYNDYIEYCKNPLNLIKKKIYCLNGII